MTKNLALVIEDDQDLSDIFTRALEQAGFEVETVLDGKAACPLACHQCFACLLSCPACFAPPSRIASMLPLFISLMFALHPVNAESVNWISGRSDVLAGMFLFASMLSLLMFKEENQRTYGVLAFVFFLGGVLAKETSLAFFPGLLLMLKVTDRPLPEHPVSSESHPAKTAHQLFLLLIGVFLVLAVFFFLRSTAFTSNTSRIGLTLMAMSDDWIHFIVLIPPEIRLLSLREEFLDFCDQLNIDAILEPIKR